MNAHQGEHKRLARSLMYFLQFGAYASYRPDTVEFGHYDTAGAWAYLRSHALIFLVWLGAAALAIGAILAPLRRWLTGAPEAVAVEGDERPAAADRGRFLAWAGVFLTGAFGLTLCWGVIQDGPLLYWNAWFDFAIYYFMALIAAAVVSGWMARVRWPDAGWITRPGVRVAAAVVVLAGMGLLSADRFRVSDAAPRANRDMQASAARVLAATAPASGVAPVEVLWFHELYWPTVIHLALQLQRAGRPFAVPGGWWLVFGKSHAWDQVPPEQQRTARAWRFMPLQTGFRRWECSPGYVAAQNTKWSADLERDFGQTFPTGSFPMLNGILLDTSIPALDPSDTRAGVAAEINFMAGGNAFYYCVGGFSACEGILTRTDGKQAVLRFRPVPVTGEAVEATLELIPFFEPAHGLLLQRLRVLFNGEPLGPEQRLESRGITQRRFTIPAAAWNRAAAAPGGADAALAFEIPDATSRIALGMVERYGDDRLLGLGFRTLRFRVVPSGPSPGP